MTDASIWQPGVVGIVSADNKIRTQSFVATAGQTVFTVTNFNYVPDTSTLQVFVEGVAQVAGVDFTETSSTTFTLIGASLVGGETVYAIAQLSVSVEESFANAALSEYLPAGTGAVATDVQDKLRESVSVKDFGAVGDGVADDTAAIQAAISSGANKIFIPAGRYKTTATIKGISTEQNPIYIYGEGSHASLISYEPVALTNYTNDTAMWFGNSTQDVPSPLYECRNLTLEDFAIYVNTNARVALRLRETYRTACKRLFLGAENYGVLDNVTCLVVDGGIDCLFEQLHCAPKNGYSSGDSLPIIALSAASSKTLDRTVGSGSGASFTSSAFNGCYFHVTNQIGNVSANQVSFNDCIFEAANTGIIAGNGSFNVEFINCYYEAINKFAVVADGADSRVVSNIVVQGGYYQSNNKAGYSGTGGFVNAKNAGKVKVTDVQIASTGPCLGRAVTATGYTHSLLLDANYYALHASTNESTPVSLTNPFETINGSPDLILNYNNHGLIQEDTISLSGFTTPVNAIPTNHPLWRVSEVVSENQVKLRALYGDRNANASGTSLGGTGSLEKYDFRFAGNFIIDSPNAVKFTDAKEHWLTFGRSYTAGGDNLPMYLGSDGATERYVTNSWSYIMYAKRARSKTQSVSAINYSYIFIDLPTGYEQDFNLGGPANISIGNYQTSDYLVGIKIPPGTAIRVRNWLAGGVSGYDYVQTQTVHLLLIECNERLSIL